MAPAVQAKRLALLVPHPCTTPTPPHPTPRTYHLHLVIVIIVVAVQRDDLHVIRRQVNQLLRIISAPPATEIRRENEGQSPPALDQKGPAMVGMIMQSFLSSDNDPHSPHGTKELQALSILPPLHPLECRPQLTVAPAQPIDVGGAHSQCPPTARGPAVSCSSRKRA
jgi:hypothetical protein